MKTTLRSPKTCVLTFVAVLTGVIMLFGSAQSASAQWTTSGTNVYYNGGNVGIGTTSPGAPLHLQGTVNGVFKLLFENLSNGGSAFSSMQWKNDAGNIGVIFMNGSANTSYGGANSLGLNNASNNPLWLGTNDTIRVFITNGGSVGIGTTSPATPLHLNSPAAGYNGVGQFHITDSANTNRVVRFGYDSTLEAGWIQASKVGTSYEPLLLNPNGANVGIGTTTPGYKLDVNGNTNVTGNLNVTGNIAAKFQDVAEWVPASGQPPAGTVVVLDSAKSNQVTSSSKAYDTRVAGVVSEQPGIALGEQSESKVLVATTGRVMVKVDASRGAIHIGDLLVTSGVPGLAMKSEPVNVGGVQLHRPGTLIGKALEPLEKGSGKIQVLLSLQ